MESVPLELLSAVPLFADLDSGDLETLANAMQRRAFHEGETVTAEGAPSEEFFVIESGEAEVSVAGEKRTVLRAGDYFGEIALLTGSERTATVKAATDLHCYGLSAPDFKAIVEGNPTIAWELMQAMAERSS